MFNSDGWYVVDIPSRTQQGVITSQGIYGIVRKNGGYYCQVFFAKTLINVAYRFVQSGSVGC